MNFATLILKNIWRQKTRTVLTIIGITIGISTIVVFGLATSGLEDMFGNMLKAGKTDFTVAKAESADIILSFIDNDQIEKIKNTQGVEEIVPFVMTMVPYGNNPYFLIGGMDKEKIDLVGVNILEGRVYENSDEIIIGKITAKNKKLKVGDKIKLGKTDTKKEKEYQIVGIYESGVSYQDSGGLTTIKESQDIQGISDKVNLVMVKVSSNYDTQEVADKIEKEDSGLVSIVDMSDYNAIDQGMNIMNSVSWGISLLAIIIGAIGVMNTIIMSVYERTREIGVLRAVGWKRWRVVAMILGESFIIGIVAAIIGSLVGIGIIWLVQQTELGESWLEVKYEWIIFIRALIVSLTVVLIGAIYPAYKASKLQPTEALRYE